MASEYVTLQVKRETKKALDNVTGAHSYNDKLLLLMKRAGVKTEQ